MLRSQLDNLGSHIPKSNHDQCGGTLNHVLNMFNVNGLIGPAILGVVLPTHSYLALAMGRQNSKCKVAIAQ